MNGSGLIHKLSAYMRWLSLLTFYAFLNKQKQNKQNLVREITLLFQTAETEYPWSFPRALTPLYPGPNDVSANLSAVTY